MNRRDVFLAEGSLLGGVLALVGLALVLSLVLHGGMALRGARAQTECEWICVTRTPAPTAVPASPVPVSTPRPALPGFGAFFLGTEPEGSYQALADLGADWAAIRVVSESAGAPLDWPRGAVADARAAGLRVLLIAWVGDDRVPDGDCGSVTDSAVVRDYVRRLVAAARPDAVAYGWEPDGCASGAAWAPVAQAAYAAVHEAGADAVLGVAFERFAPGGPFDPDFLADLVDASGGAPFADVVAFSGFDDFHARWQPPGLVGKRAAVARVTGALSLGMVGGGLPSAPSDAWTRRSEALQARGITRILVECADAELELCLLYRAVDQPGEWAAFGLLRSDGSRKPAADAFADTVARLRAGEAVAVVGGRGRIGKR